MLEIIEEIKTICVENNFTLSVAESCTGGYLSHLITTIPGSSLFYKGSVVAYWVEFKEKILHVSKDTISLHTVVSPQVAIEMAKGVSRLFGSTIGLSTTGIAGPTGELFKRPVGTVCIGLHSPWSTFSKILKLEGERFDIIKKASFEALKILLRVLHGRKASNKYTEQTGKGGEGGVFGDGNK